MDLAWILPSHLPASALASHPWPLYGESPLNTLPAAWHGQDPFNHWQIPPKWTPYLLKNEVIVHPSPQNPVAVPLTLYITLQGTVFLYPQTYSGTIWLGANSYIADVPPSTILAEFVPLKPAVLAGIIPVSGGQPSGINGYTAPIWEHVLQMSATQIEHALH